MPQVRATVLTCLDMRGVGTSVQDPDPYDPKVVWPPGSGSVIQRY